MTCKLIAMHALDINCHSEVFKSPFFQHRNFEIFFWCDEDTASCHSIAEEMMRYCRSGWSCTHSCSSLPLDSFSLYPCMCCLLLFYSLCSFHSPKQVEADCRPTWSCFCGRFLTLLCLSWFVGFSLFCKHLTVWSTLRSLYCDLALLK